MNRYKLLVVIINLEDQFEFVIDEDIKAVDLASAYSEAQLLVSDVCDDLDKKYNQWFSYESLDVDENAIGRTIRVFRAESAIAQVKGYGEITGTGFIKLIEENV